MVGNRLRLRALLAALALASLLLGTAATEASARTAWDDSLDLYRSGTYTVQKTWLWCTAADVQIIKNIVDGQRDHSTSSQRRYFEWMRARNRYDLPLSAGVDPVGWTAGLRHFVDTRYRLVSSGSFDGALRSAVQRMRATELPVALAVDNGNHGWVLTGFSATKDPATSKDFKVTAVRVVGPLYGLNTRSFGYDMRPGKSLTVKQLRQFFTPWRYAPKRMIWDGRYVSIQPVPAAPPAQKAHGAATGAAARGRPSPSPTAAAVRHGFLAGPRVARSGGGCSRRPSPRRRLGRRYRRPSAARGTGRRADAADRRSGRAADRCAGGHHLDGARPPDGEVLRPPLVCGNSVGPPSTGVPLGTLVATVATPEGWRPGSCRLELLNHMRRRLVH